MIKNALTFLLVFISINSFSQVESLKTIINNSSRWAHALGIFSGYGIFTENINNHYKNNVPIGATFDLYYNNFVLSTRLSFGFTKTVQDIPYFNGIWQVWEDGSPAVIYIMEASLGHVLIENSWIRLVPYSGITTVDISPPEYDLLDNPELEKVELKFTRSYVIGLNADLKLKPSKRLMMQFGPGIRYWFLNFRYGYNFLRFDTKYNGFNGNMHHITIGFGFFGRKIIREY